MKRYYPIFVAVIVAIGVFWYVISSKHAEVSSASYNSATPSSTPTPSKAALADGTHTGKSIPTDYGDIQIELVVSQGKITAVNILKRPGNESRSIEINTNAIPRLQSEILTAQSANVNAISGATFTSEGFVKAAKSAFAS